MLGLCCVGLVCGVGACCRVVGSCVALRVWFGIALACVGGVYGMVLCGCVLW